MVSFRQIVYNSTMLEMITTWLVQYGYIGLFLLLTFGILGLPIPDETIMTFSGYLIFSGTFNPVVTYLVAFAGSCCGITLSYILGKTLGAAMIKKVGKKLRLPPGKMDNVHDWFLRSGKWSLTYGYFFPGIRHFTAIVAGSSKLSWHSFALYAYLGAALWSASFVTLGYLLGEGWKRTSEQVHWWLGIGTLVIVAAFLIHRLIRWLRNRRQPIT